MVFKRIKIAELVPAAYNPRKALKPGDKEYEKIKNSISEFGYVDPVIVNSDMTVIGGHQRITVLKDLGFTEIDCVVIDIDKTKEKALNVALNKITGEWNKDLLADLIADLQDSDFDVSFTGFDPPEIEQLMSAIHDKEIIEDDFDIDAELEKPAVSRLGDIWILGDHRLLCGDSTLPENYDLLLEGKRVNLVVTDPPYEACAFALANIETGCASQDDRNVVEDFIDKMGDFIEIYQKRCFDRKKGKTRQLQVHNIRNFYLLLAFEFSRLQKNEKVLKRCKNCGCIFVPIRRNGNFCFETRPGFKRPCNEIGRTWDRDERRRNDPIEKEHNQNRARIGDLKKTQEMLRKMGLNPKNTVPELIRQEQERYQAAKETKIRELALDNLQTQSTKEEENAGR